MNIICERVFPEDPLMFDVPMVKFKFVTEDWSLSFVVKDKFSPDKLKEALHEISEQEIEAIISIVLETYSEEEIGETEFSEITSVVTIKRILPS